MDPIIARFNWSADDYLNIRKYTPKRRQRPPLAKLMLASAAILFGSGMPEYMLICIGGAGALALDSLIIYLSNKLMIRRQSAKLASPGVELLLILSNECILQSTIHGKSETYWTAIDKVITTPAGFIFQHNFQPWTFIPVRAFSSAEDIENLKTLAREHAAVFKELK